MKTNRILAFITAAFALVASPLVHAHGEKVEIGPNGGRVLSVKPAVELFITAERKVKLTFLGGDKKAVAVKDQTATATGGDRANPTKLTFVKEGDALVSDKPLPEGKIVPLVIQIKETADAKAAVEKLNVNLANCSGCNHPEYACTCEAH